MKYIYLGSENISEIGDVHENFSKNLNFPEYYGNNFDALFDCLSEYSGKLLILVSDASLLKERLGKTVYETLLNVISDAQKENPLIKTRFFL